MHYADQRQRHLPHARTPCGRGWPTGATGARGPMDVGGPV